MDPIGAAMIAVGLTMALAGLVVIAGTIVFAVGWDRKRRR